MKLCLFLFYFNYTDNTWVHAGKKELYLQKI